MAFSRAPAAPFSGSRRAFPGTLDTNFRGSPQRIPGVLNAFLCDGCIPAIKFRGGLPGRDVSAWCLLLRLHTASMLPSSSRIGSPGKELGIGKSQWDFGVISTIDLKFSAGKNMYSREEVCGV